MSSEDEDDVYKLVTELCKHYLDKRAVKNEHIYSSQNNSLCLKKLRAKSYEILLNKSSSNVYRNKDDYDPVCELLKHSFILRSLGRIYEANELDECLEHLSEMDESISDSNLLAVLTILNELKSYESNASFDLNIFNTEKYSQNIPTYEMYSMETLKLMSHRFQPLLTESSNHEDKPKYNLPFINHLSLTNEDVDENAVEFSKSEKYNSQSVVPMSHNLFKLPSISQSSLKSNLWDEELKKDKYSVIKEGIVTEPESPWQFLDFESVSESWDNQDPRCNNDEFDDEIWSRIDSIPDVPEYRTWEALGILDPERESPFITESNNAMIHLTKLKHISIHPIISKNDSQYAQPLKEISRQKFIENTKLLLLGIESECFVHHEIIGFCLVKNIIVPELSRNTLENFCFELIDMGNCYRSLSQLVSQEATADTFNTEGLIFKALCNNLNEVLSFYKASVSLIQLKNDGLVNFVNTIRPLRLLLKDIAMVCDFRGQKTETLDRGINILKYIYHHASTTTKPNTSLVIYSMLKSCCEVYFRLLQRWLFEGVCEDTYDEFMIKTKSKYLNVKAHRFWTRAFEINSKNVPGFLSDLTESILECGKAIRLLKICDPKNPICHLSTHFHPTIKVCLNVEMQNEQIKFYEHYYEKGEEAIGETISFWSAIQKEKDVLKHEKHLVSLIQQERILKLKKKREENLRKIAEEKNKLLAILKNQAEESALRKVRDRNAEILADKEFLKNVMEKAAEAKNIEQLKKAETHKYYNELAAESEKSLLRAEWRIKRMNLFDERILLLSNLKTENEFEPPVSKTLEIEIPMESEVTVQPENENIEHMEVEDDIEMFENCLPEDLNENEDVEEMEINDENENFENMKDSPSNNTLSVKFSNETDGSFENSTTKVKRPNVLDLSEQIFKKTESLLNFKETDNMSAAQRNKLRMLKEEFAISPNNNLKSDIALLESGDKNVNFLEDAFRMEGKANRLKNTRHKMNDNWDTLDNPKKTYGSNIAQQNRTKNLAHQFGVQDKNEKTSTTEMLTIAQKNRNKVMLHSVEHWFDATENVDNEGLKSTETEINSASPADLRETPMSCTTDHYTYSINSSSVPFQSCEATPDFEIESDINSDEIKSRLSNDEEQKKMFMQFSQHNYGFFQSPSKTFSHASESTKLTTDDVRMLNSTFLQEYLKKSVMIPLQAQNRLVNTAIIKYFIQEHNLLTHLHSLRSYFFLLNGEFAKSLTQSLYKQLYQVKMPIKMLNATFLKTTLEKAISCSINHNYKNSELLSLSVTNIPTKFEVSNPEVLDGISLNYKITWPVNIIFDDAVMEQYSKVFKFLLMVGRVLWVLQEEFHILKYEKKSTTFSEQFHKIQLYRFSMMQFMNALHTYLTCSVLHASWTEFEKELELSTTLDKFYAAHVSYIKRILSRCMLNQRSEMILKSLSKTFSVILKFHNRITTHSGELDRRNFEMLEGMYNSFCQQRAYVAHVAEKFSSSGYQPHLTHFLHALNINDSFQLDTKKSSTSLKT